MNVTEMSNEFDTLLNSYSIIPPTGFTDPMAFNEYEKSVFLTLAQEQIVVGLYTGETVGDSFEKTERIRRYLSELVKTYQTEQTVSGHTGLTPTSVFFQLPEDTWFITYESVTLTDDKLGCANGTEVLVYPVTQDDFHKIMKNPFRGPSKNRVLRLDTDEDVVEIVSIYNVSKYLLRYLARPTPIILTNLNDLTIGGLSVVTECQLDEVLHRVILERAVLLALQSKAQNATRDNK